MPPWSHQTDQYYVILYYNNIVLLMLYCIINEYQNIKYCKWYCRQMLLIVTLLKK